MTFQCIFICSHPHINIFLHPVNSKLMEKASIPKSPNSRPAAEVLKASPTLNPSKSEQKLMKNQLGSQRRLRLRDYLFAVSAASQRNSAKKQDLKNSIIEKDALRQSISLIKHNKRCFPNSEMYAIIKAEIIKEMSLIVQDLQTKLAILNSEQLPNPTSQDLNYLYNFKRVMNDNMRTAIRQIDELTFRKNSSVIKQIFNMYGTNIRQQNEEDADYDQKLSKLKPNLQKPLKSSVEKPIQKPLENPVKSSIEKTNGRPIQAAVRGHVKRSIEKRIDKPAQKDVSTSFLKMLITRPA